jgi:hypothetical protein
MKKEYVKIPKFLDYEILDYSEDYNFERDFETCSGEFDNCGVTLRFYTIFDILNAPSIEAAEEKFKGLYIHDIKIKVNEDNVLLQEEQKEIRTLKEHFINFCIKNKVSKKLQEKLIGDLQ